MFEKSILEFFSFRENGRFKVNIWNSTLHNLPILSKFAHIFR
ncbi:hypothetical protein SPHINGO8BC_51301 [Sphingobacterium multivorum]|uniref:Uncharacterized protein n=1 Tax=Sphingobacterium multivorum TaxID=28454 RepID=A0A654CXX9_SPHMU|nr:hypothetical protein SPHINGO8BC_51301 [Sphingobacterium multivorum]